MGKVFYIINPAGHGGAGIKAWEEFKLLWPASIDSEHVAVTEHPGHAREIATNVKGYDTIAVVGGDGTVGEVMSAIMDRGQHELRLAIIPAGTGNDIGRNVGIKSIEDAVNALRNGRTQAFDIMRVDSQLDNQPVHYYGFLACAVGFSAIPMIKPWMKRLLGPKGGYYLATILQLLRYKPTKLKLKTEKKVHNGYTWLVIIGNAEKTAGGSMCLAPGARTDDGELNISIFPSGSRVKMGVKLMPKIASGSHVNEPGISYFPGKRIEIESNPPAIVELDGDLCGKTPAKIEVYPQAMQIMTPNS